MNNFKIGLSLRYKLLLMLTSLPLISLGLYLAMATDLFQQDKVAYVFDSSATMSRSLATQTRMEAQTIYQNMRTVVENFDFNSSVFNGTGKNLFHRNEKMYAILLLRRDATGQYVQLGHMNKESEAAQKFLEDGEALRVLRDQAVSRTVFIIERDSLPGGLAVAFRLGQYDEPNHMVVIGLYQSDDLLNAFQSSGIYSSFVVSRGGFAVIRAMDVVGSDLQILRNVLAGQANEGTTEARLSDGQIYLISYSSVGMGDLLVISRVDKAKALKAVEVLIVKSLLFFVALLGSTLIISVIASSRLTSTLRELFEATKRIAQGDFNVKVEASSRDEVGGLAVSFNWMAAEVSRLMSETAEKARMQSELSTVKTVQETLFPASQTQFGPIQIMGHFEPASECGGDWWNYSREGNRIYLWIGDATGHGAPAALITSAARSAAAVIELLPEVSPGKALSILNKAIHQTSKGQIMMTFFVACLDLDQKTLTYSSASHDPPYLIRRTGEKISKKDLIPLNEVNGPRLGDQKEFLYDDHTVELNEGDFLFLYTDGILDVQDKKGNKWGERAFLKSLIECANMTEGIEGRLGNLRHKIEAFREGSELIDDVTMVMCHFDKEAA